MKPADASTMAHGSGSQGDVFASWGGEDTATSSPSRKRSSPPSRDLLGILAMAAGLAIAIAAAIRGFGIHSGSSSYQVGEITGTVVVFVAAGALFRWGLGRFSAERQSAPAGMALRQPGTRRAGIALVALLAAGVVVAALLGSGAQVPATSWSSPQGVQARDGFVAGCENSGETATDCECVFSHLVSYRQYDTPARFLTLGSAVEQYQRTGDTADIPAAYVVSAHLCLDARS